MLTGPDFRTEAPITSPSLPTPFQSGLSPRPSPLIIDLFRRLWEYYLPKKTVTDIGQETDARFNRLNWVISTEINSIFNRKVNQLAKNKERMPGGIAIL